MAVLLAMCFIDTNAAEVLPVYKGSSYCTSYHVGDTGPEKGKVFYVDESGCHGLEAKATDEINSLSWKDAYIDGRISRKASHNLAVCLERG